MDKTIFKAALKSQDKTVEMEAPVLLFQEEGIYFSYLPSFRLTGYGHSSKESIKSLVVVLEEYFTLTMEQGTLLADLEKCGWKRNKMGQLAAPDFSTLLKIDQEVKEIVFNKSSYSKQPASITIPILA